MVGKRKRTVHRKSRKSRGFLGVQKQQCKDTEISHNQEESISDNDAQSSGESDPCPTETVPLSASRRKLAQHEADHTPNETEDANLELPEYRFVDIQRLSSPLSDLHKCEDGKFLFISFQKFFLFFHNSF